MKRIKDSNRKDLITAQKAGYHKKKYAWSTGYSYEKYFPSTDKGFLLLRQAQVCYDSLLIFRKNRRRNRDYYRGKQWNDIVTVNGQTMTEEAYINQQGKPALKQNMIRPQVKNILGQFRSNPYKSVVVSRNREDQMASEMMSVALESVYAMNSGKERDARLLEEFLISGSAIYITQYSYDSERQRAIPKFRPIDVNRFFQTPNSSDICGEDIDFIGDFVDISLDEVISLYAGNSKSKEAELRNIYATARDRYHNTDQQLSQENNKFLSLQISSNPELCRVLRICRLEARWMLEVHDYADASYEIREIADEKIIIEENNTRIALGEEQAIEIPLIEYERKYLRVWNYYHITPYGNILFEMENPYLHKNHPYVYKFYPLLDGEAWSMVDDLIDQQKMINRLVILYDFIVAASAKGVLLVPEECIPDDMDLEDIAEEWTKYNGVIKIKAKPGVELPKQVSVSNINIGIGDMINMQMKFMQDIGGVHNALQGKAPDPGTPSSLYQQESMNAQLNILDYLESFQSLLQVRDYRMLQLIKQYYNEPQYISLSGKSYSEQSKYFDPEKIRNIDFDNQVTKSNDTASYRLVIDGMLEKLLMNNFIGVEMYLEHCSYPFSDKILQQIKVQKEQLANGQVPNNATLQSISEQVKENVPQSEIGLNNAKRLMYGKNAS